MTNRIAPGKKRHMLTLTESVVEEFQTIIRENGFAPSTMSAVVDEYLREMTKVIRQAIERGSFTMKDYMSMIGEQMDLIREEKTANAKNGKKASSGQEITRHRVKS